MAHNNKVNDVKSYSWLSFSLHEKSPTELKVHLYSDLEIQQEIYVELVSNISQPDQTHLSRHGDIW